MEWKWLVNFKKGMILIIKNRILLSGGHFYSPQRAREALEKW